ncbi:hypothetical protein BP6252_01726 [Coleophoma cylindrospora]|uniref:NACHT domain-containing protein n=1 Tax=Coleophoma cylindrospora TaxID=1849047 RepID=A0A3D8STW1_9HELO|nr:hypothetical protein BP6252_01726 [Coleophoma cylindrospora]
MVRTREDRTYRVKQLPLHLELPNLATFLAQLDGRIGPADSIKVHSIAGALSLEDNPKFKVATVTFINVPALFDNDRQEWTVEVYSLSEEKRRRLNVKEDIIFDTHFLGFTPLNDVPSEDHVADCIAISGLASHPFGSWKRRDTPAVRSNFMWLRDQLPKDEPCARYILYGYDTRLLMSQSFQTIDDLAITLINRLEAIGRHRPNAKPVVFLCHSLGGIILKRALVEMANNGPRQVSMLNSTIGVVAFGVPSKGMDMSHLRLMVEGHPNAKLVEVLSPTSTYLSEWSQRFNGLAQISHIRLISVYETTRTSVPTERDGKWVKEDDYRELVEPASAILPGSARSDLIAINRDHSGLVKFEQGCDDYEVVRQKLHDIWRIQQQSNKSNVRDTHESSRTFTVSHVGDISSSEYQDILDSLYVAEVNLRVHEVEQPFQHTFDWAWTDRNLTLQAWLQNKNDNCWIKGKPGSGKSTLMKYLYDESSTYPEAQLAMCGSPSTTARWIRIGFFFHNRGSYMQKSLEGLLHSIIHQLLTEERRLAEIVQPIFQQRPHKSGTFQWTLMELQEALSAILEQNIRTIHIAFFLDALDEYNGPPSTVIEVVRLIVKAQKSPTTKTKLKLLFSSRPWNAFLDAFKDIPSFSIQDFTQGDIDRFVKGKFKESPSAQELLEAYDPPEPNEAQDLVEEIVAKAEGVFLWVKLVVDEFLSSSEDGLTMLEARAMLARFPPDLNQLYQGIIDRVPLAYRSESHAMLEIAFRSTYPLEVEVFWSCVTCAPLKTLKDCFPVLETTRPSIETIKRRIRSRCGGLLETVASLAYDEIVVQFMHQTAKEFVGTPGFTRLLLPNKKELPTENGFSFVFKYGLATSFSSDIMGSSSTTSQETVLTRWQQHILQYSEAGFQAEQTTSKSQRPLIDEMEQLLPPEVKYASQSKIDDIGVNNALSFAAVSNLQLYATETLICLENETISRSKPAKPLLHCVVGFIRSKRFYIGGRYHAVTSLAGMISLLIHHGENINEVFDGLVPFQCLFYDFDLVNEVRSYSTNALLAAEEFLCGGQDPDVNITTTSRYSQPATTCKLIHIADIPLKRLLLRHKANVNALTSAGHTPLDICVRIEGNPFEIGDHRKPSQAIEEAFLLLSCGACLSHKGEPFGRLFVRILDERADIEVPQCFRKMPVLSKRHGVWKGKCINADRDPSVKSSDLQFQKNSSEETLPDVQDSIAKKLVEVGPSKAKDLRSSEQPNKTAGKRKIVARLWAKVKPSSS